MYLFQYLSSYLIEVGLCKDLKRLSTAKQLSYGVNVKYYNEAISLLDTFASIIRNERLIELSENLKKKLKLVWNKNDISYPTLSKQENNKKVPANSPP